ncbi:hypothetical protein ACIRS1_02140 [Kitasatospora sp. NPDC101176]|uniref:hypothetical protein n=1 Tax=Kitasatospora sp. NPDC101176 TaxID=3364099 RepID=UPI00381E417A
MSTGGDNAAFGAGTAADGTDAWVGRGLADAATGARIGSVPLPDIMAGGRRIRRRRRTMVGALALAATVALAGGVTATLHPGPGGAPQPLVAANSGPATGTGAAPDTDRAPTTAPAAKDPFTPVRVVIGQGTVDGKEWKLWQAVWPAAPKERAYEQALAVWQERNAVDPTVEKPTTDFVQHYWSTTEDVVNTYATLDGVRQKYDSQGSFPDAAHFDPRDGDYIGGGVIGPRSKDGTPGPLPIRLASVTAGPDVGRIVVTWTDGTVLEPQLVPVGDTPYRHVVVPEQPGRKVQSWQFFAKDGTRIPDSGLKLLTE